MNTMLALTHAGPVVGLEEASLVAGAGHLSLYIQVTDVRAATFLMATIVHTWNNPQWKPQYNSVILTHWGLVMPYAEISVNIGSGNGLLPDGNQAITWTNVDW